MHIAPYGLLKLIEQKISKFILIILHNTRFNMIETLILVALREFLNHLKNLKTYIIKLSFFKSFKTKHFEYSDSISIIEENSWVNFL